MDAVVAEGLRKTYGERVALDAVSLAVDAGEVFGLIGPNGAGKTTLVRALTGTVEPDAGSALVLGSSPTAVDRERIGVLPQEFGPPDRLTVRELLAYYAGLYARARDPATVLAEVGLVEAADTWYENLSGGQRRRVCVGCALVNDPDVLFLDEPTTGIDPAGRRTVWGLIESLAASGTTVFLTTHDMREAERLADRVGLLAEGELVAVGTPADLVAEHGGPSRLTVDLEAEIDSSTALETLEDVGFTAEVHAGDLVVRGVAAREIGTIASSLDDRVVEYTGLSWSEPGLEDVYLELAGDVERSSTTAKTAAPRSDEQVARPGGDR